MAPFSDPLSGSDSEVESSFGGSHRSHRDLKARLAAAKACRRPIHTPLSR